MQNPGFVTRSTTTFAALQNPPLSDTLIFLQDFASGLEKNPCSTNIDALPARLRLAVLKGLGESGYGRMAGLKSVLSFTASRRGSTAPPGLLEGDEAERRRKENFREWLLYWLEHYRQMFYQTAAAIQFAETHVEDVISTLDKGLKILEAHAADNPFDDAADPQGVSAIRQYKQEAERFRDEELPDLKKALQQPNLPPREQLAEIHDTVNNKIGRFQRFKQSVIEKTRETAQASLETAGQIASESFDYAARKVDEVRSRWRRKIHSARDDNDINKPDYSNN